jgi:hypothetical protein
MIVWVAGPVVRLDGWVDSPRRATQRARPAQFSRQGLRWGHSKQEVWQSTAAEGMPSDESECFGWGRE